MLLILVLAGVPGPDPLTLQACINMGRTLHYEVRSEKPVDWNSWREIRAVEALMNLRFTWTCEELSLGNPYREETVVRKTPTEPPVQHQGFTKVRDDEWNAELVFQFCWWLSRRLPDATIKLSDEGDYVLLGRVLFRGGRLETDDDAMARQIKHLEKHGLLAKYLPRIEEARVKAKRGIFFASVPASDYAERPEIKALNIPTDELATLTLHELSARFAFPWETEHLDEAAT